MSKKLGHKSETREGCRARLEHQYGIDRHPLEAKLREAIDQQRQLDEFVRKHASEANEWTGRASHLRKRQVKNLRAFERTKAEIEESNLDPSMHSQLLVRMKYLFHMIDSGLRLREACANLVATVVRSSTMRGRGQPTRAIVNDCLKSLVEQMRDRHGRPLPKETALDYVAALAQSFDESGRDLKDPAAALRKRVKNIKGRKALAFTADQLTTLTQLIQTLPVNLDGWPAPAATLRERVAHAREIALGQWPDELIFKLPEPPSTGSPRRRPYLSSENDRFHAFDDALAERFREAPDPKI